MKYLNNWRFHISSGLIFALASLIFFVGCVETFSFRIKNNNPTLVVEASISNVSYHETLAYPSDGRYFKVRLRETNDVINLDDNALSQAEVILLSDQNESWIYAEIPEGSGDYLLKDDNFKALPDRKYKLSISLTDGKKFESSWEKINLSDSEMGDISYEETEKLEYVVEANEKVINSIKGINLQINVPEQSTSSPVYYMWDLEPSWVYIAPLARWIQNDKVCWATSPYYMKSYGLQISRFNGYTTNLVFIKTIRNERIFEHLSVLVKQYSMSEDYYFFWEEMKKQSQSKGIFEAPPFNLKTNFTSLTNSDEKVSGYFGVVEEKTKRWYFNIGDLSYYVQNTLKGDCLIDYGDGPAPECLSCLEYSNGNATIVFPSWWPYTYK